MKEDPFYSVFSARLGPVSGLVLTVERRGKILALRYFFPPRENFRKWIKREYPGARERTTGLLGAVEKAIREYFRGGHRKQFDFPLDFSDYTDFQKRILGETRKIPYGRIISYRWLAEKAGAPRAFRAAGRALGANRHLLLVPCHRVIRTSGNPGGFSAPGGPAVKIWLLKLEKAQGFAAGPGLGAGNMGGGMVFPARTS
ncbi:MAG: methylated-DNA--[protein]-cysteine S-methyltransferase [bacterium]|nr:methylated-DNA--[protein]-cysteine S-methyltransferase [bacterium]